MKLKDLREKLKSLYPEARDSYASTTGEHANMREFWMEVDQAVDRYKEYESSTGISLLHPCLIRFHRAGQLYYHAKKHGVESAMLYRLSRD